MGITENAACFNRRSLLSYPSSLASFSTFNMLFSYEIWTYLFVFQVKLFPRKMSRSRFFALIISSLSEALAMLISVKLYHFIARVDLRQINS